MEQIIRIDKQGRLVLPASVRESMGLKDGGKVSVRLDGFRVIIEPVFMDLEKSVKTWRESTLELHVNPFTEDITESWKWMSRDYARRKVGIS